MNRLGWIVLLVFAAVVAGFALMMGGGGDGSTTPEPAKAPERTISGLAIPVAGAVPGTLTDTWAQARANGAREHHAIDIMAPRGTPVVAAAPGRVEKLFDSDDGGHTIYVRSPDGDFIFYYAHLDSYLEGLAEGQQVRTGQVIGTVGSTGNASPEAPHLHFEIKRMGPGESWWQGREINPYPLLARKAAAS